LALLDSSKILDGETAPKQLMSGGQFLSRPAHPPTVVGDVPSNRIEVVLHAEQKCFSPDDVTFWNINRRSLDHKVQVYHALFVLFEFVYAFPPKVT
jgi:hypothetical protein